MPGRNGQPGADFDTLPQLRPRVSQFAAFFWYGRDHTYLDLFNATASNDTARNKRVSKLQPFCERLALAFRKIAEKPTNNQ